MSWEAAKEVLALAAARLEGMSGVKRWRQKKREQREGFLRGCSGPVGGAGRSRVSGGNGRMDDMLIWG